jgi:hypothetical protein
MNEPKLGQIVPNNMSLSDICYTDGKLLCEINKIEKNKVYWSVKNERY